MLCAEPANNGQEIVCTLLGGKALLGVALKRIGQAGCDRARMKADNECLFLLSGKLNGKSSDDLIERGF